MLESHGTLDCANAFASQFTHWKLRLSGIPIVGVSFLSDFSERFAISH